MNLETHLYKGLPKGFLKAFKKKTDIRENVICMFLMILNTRFKWTFENETAREELESYIIEKLLNEEGRCFIFESGGHYFNTLVAEKGQLDAVGRLVKARAITLDGTIFNDRVIRNIVHQDENGKTTIEKPNAVLIKNNLYDLSTITILTPFIDTLNYIWQTLQINLSNARVKRIITAVDNNQTNVIKKEITKLIDGVESVAVITDKNAVDGLKTLESASSNADITEIKELYDWLYNWLLTYLGINNMANIDKQSGMTPQEINSNTQQVSQYLNSMLFFRKKACDELNKLYNIGAKIEIVNDFTIEDKNSIVDNMTNKEL